MRGEEWRGRPEARLRFVNALAVFIVPALPFLFIAC